MPFLDPDELYDSQTQPPVVKNGAFPLASVACAVEHRQLALVYGAPLFYTMTLEQTYRSVSGGGETTTADRTIDVWVPSFCNLMGFKAVGSGSGVLKIEYGSIDYFISMGGGDSDAPIANKKQSLSLSSGPLAPAEMIAFTAADTPQRLELTVTPGTDVYIEQLIVVFSKTSGSI
jgi:hypothetical protein